MRVRQLIDYMFPDGTRANDQHTEHYPIWPPDLFACSALIVDRSSAYPIVIVPPTQAGGGHPI
ncbi:MAG: hypothetical protein MRY76_10385 [Pseudomonadales bacterium]|nr:hypothetical protein [Pseudomonadales bacterium]